MSAVTPLKSSAVEASASLDGLRIDCTNEAGEHLDRLAVVTLEDDGYVSITMPVDCGVLGEDLAVRVPGWAIQQLYTSALNPAPLDSPVGVYCADHGEGPRWWVRVGVTDYSPEDADFIAGDIRAAAQLAREHAGQRR